MGSRTSATLGIMITESGVFWVPTERCDRDRHISEPRRRAKELFLIRKWGGGGCSAMSTMGRCYRVWEHNDKFFLGRRCGGLSGIFALCSPSTARVQHESAAIGLCGNLCALRSWRDARAALACGRRAFTKALPMGTSCTQTAQTSRMVHPVGKLVSRAHRRNITRSPGSSSGVG